MNTAETATDRAVSVYELYDIEGNALYIGASVHPAGRFSAHRAKPWWAEVDFGRTIVTSYPNAWQAMSMERERIAALSPKHNLSGVTVQYIPYPTSTPTTPEVMAPEGEQLAQAREALQEATRAARTAAIAAMGEGMSESEAARQYGVTRMTIRAWKNTHDNPLPQERENP